MNLVLPKWSFNFTKIHSLSKTSVPPKRTRVFPWYFSRSMKYDSIVTRLNAETATQNGIVYSCVVFRASCTRVFHNTHGTSVYESLGDLNAIQLYPDNDTTILTIITYREEETFEWKEAFHGAREAKFKPYAHTEGQTDRQTGRQTDRQTEKKE